METVVMSPCDVEELGSSGWIVADDVVVVGVVGLIIGSFSVNRARFRKPFALN